MTSCLKILFKYNHSVLFFFFILSFDTLNSNLITWEKGPQWSYPLSSSMIGGVVASGANTLNSYVSGNHVGPVNGVIARMSGIGANQPTGTGWDIAIGVS